MANMARMAENNQEADDMTIENFMDLIDLLNKEDLLVQRASIAERFQKPMINITPIECIARECKILTIK